MIYFSDASHPMFNALITYGWTEKGTEFDIKTNSGRQRINIIGAIEINTKDVIARSCGSVNRRSVCELLKSIRRKNPEEETICVIFDNASYNRSKKVRKLARKLNIRILFLPPYSPNLNPIERLWKFMKKKVMANSYYETFPEFKEAIVNFFRYIRKYKSNISTLIT